MSVYLLPKYVYLCLSGEQVVILDLQSDQYIALDAAKASSLARFVRGWPALITPGEARTAAVSNMGAAFAQMMSARGLLTTDCELGKEATPLTITLPSVSLLDDGAPTRRATNCQHVSAFLIAAATAAAKLRWLSMARVVSDVTRRTIVHVAPGNTFDIAAAKELVEIFYRLRPFFFTAHNACLFDSLALLNFLSRFKLFPHWVFGVETAPFAAHCWIQHGQTVFNDTVEHVRRYTPIMMV